MRPTEHGSHMKVEHIYSLLCIMSVTWEYDLIRQFKRLSLLDRLTALPLMYAGVDLIVHSNYNDLR